MLICYPYSDCTGSCSGVRMESRSCCFRVCPIHDCGGIPREQVGFNNSEQWRNRTKQNRSHLYKLRNTQKAELKFHDLEWDNVFSNLSRFQGKDIVYIIKHKNWLDLHWNENKILQMLNWIHIRNFWVYRRRQTPKNAIKVLLVPLYSEFALITRKMLHGALSNFTCHFSILWTNIP